MKHISIIYFLEKDNYNLLLYKIAKYIKEKIYPLSSTYPYTATLKILLPLIQISQPPCRHDIGDAISLHGCIITKLLRVFISLGVIVILDGGTFLFLNLHHRPSRQWLLVCWKCVCVIHHKMWRFWFITQDLFVGFSLLFNVGSLSVVVLFPDLFIFDEFLKKWLWFSLSQFQYGSGLLKLLSSPPWWPTLLVYRLSPLVYRWWRSWF